MEKNPPQNSGDPMFALPGENAANLTDTADFQFREGLRFGYAETRDGYLLAAECYRRAAKQGHSLAQFNLSVMYSRGQGLVRDLEMSRYWLTKAANGGDCGAQYTLGMVQNRRSLDEEPAAAMESRVEAYKWLCLAATQGHDNAAAGCDLVAIGMTLDTVREAKRRVEAFVSRPGNESLETQP
jgi:TPR repeat protein